MRIRNAQIHSTIALSRSRIANNSQIWSICRASDPQCAGKFDRKVQDTDPLACSVQVFIKQLKRTKLFLQWMGYGDISAVARTWASRVLSATNDSVWWERVHSIFSWSIVSATAKMAVTPAGSQCPAKLQSLQPFCWYRCDCYSIDDCVYEHIKRSVIFP